MPDFNFLNPAVLEYHQNNLRFWLNRGVDGFRFDAVTHLVENGASAWQNQPENYALVAQLRSTVMGYSQRYLVCEATSNAAVWSSDSNCGSAFAFGHQLDVVNAARGQSAAISAVANYFASAPASLATMISNHDLFAGDRLWNQVGGDLAQYRLAAATYLLQPGTPFIYYGEEIGMSAANSLSGDGRLRTPMSWSADATTAGFSSVLPFRPVSSNVASNNVAAAQADPNSLLAFYKAILTLRNTYPSIARGSYQAAFVSGSAIGFQRWLGNEKTLVLLNYGSSAAAVRVDNLGASAKWTALYPGGGAAATADASGGVTLTLPAQSVQVFALAPG
jgi:glycosidase